MVPVVKLRTTYTWCACVGSEVMPCPKAGTDNAARLISWVAL